MPHARCLKRFTPPGKVGFIPHWRKGNYDEVCHRNTLFAGMMLLHATMVLKRKSYRLFWDSGVRT
jgi:hypothetical protein